jgi:hypothetical protein
MFYGGIKHVHYVDMSKTFQHIHCDRVDMSKTFYDTNPAYSYAVRFLFSTFAKLIITPNY